MELDALKQQAFAAEDAASAEAEAVSAFLYAHPELGDQEIRSSRYLADMIIVLVNLRKTDLELNLRLHLKSPMNAINLM